MPLERDVEHDVLEQRPRASGTISTIQRSLKLRTRVALPVSLGKSAGSLVQWDIEEASGAQMSKPLDVTALLVAWNNGDARARDRLMEAVYDELRRSEVLGLR